MTADRAQVEYWIHRVYHNTFTREGRLHTAPGWSVKIQFRGRRRTFRLASRKRAVAAVEARDIYLEWTGSAPAPKGRRVARSETASLTVGQFLSRVSKQALFQPRTLRVYATAVRRIASDICGLLTAQTDVVPLDRLGPEKVRAWHAAFLSEAGDSAMAQARASRTAATYLRCASSLFGDRILNALGISFRDFTPFRNVRVAGRKPEDYPKTDPRHWKLRLIRRKYSESAHTAGEGEFSVRIEHQGTHHYFPLSEADPERASEKALEVYTAIREQGWKAALRNFPREITIALFWDRDPLACTYSTVFTRTAPVTEPANIRAVPDAFVRVIEPDAGVARALMEWIGRNPGFAPLNSISRPSDLQNEGAPGGRAGLLLINDQFRGECEESQIHRFCPAIYFGVLRDSDQLFLSIGGAAAGYILRRLPPGEMLRPIANLERLTPKTLQQAIQNYFQSFFGKLHQEPGNSTLANLTTREQEILNCLSRGFLDKEIAHALRISAWTVHNHLKNIYEKLNVHTRTEAVVKHLQK